MDADSAGLWTEDTSSEPTSVKSCTGYAILFANGPASLLPTLPCHTFDITATYYTIFEENKSCVELSDARKMRLLSVPHF